MQTAGISVTAEGGEFPPGHAQLPVKDIGRLLVRCADRPGLVAAVTTFLAGAGAMAEGCAG